MGNGAMPNGPSYRAHPRLYPSVTAGAQAAFPKLGADRSTINLATTAARDPFPTLTQAVSSLCMVHFRETLHSTAELNP